MCGLSIALGYEELQSYMWINVNIVYSKIVYMYVYIRMCKDISCIYL